MQRIFSFLSFDRMKKTEQNNMFKFWVDHIIMYAVINTKCRRRCTQRRNQNLFGRSK